MRKFNFCRIIALLCAVVLSFSSMIISVSAEIERVNNNYLGNYAKVTDPDWSWITISENQINLQAVYYDNKYICVSADTGHIKSNSFGCSSDSYIKCDSKGGNRKLYKEKVSYSGDVRVKANIFGIEYIDVKLNSGDGSIYRKR